MSSVAELPAANSTQSAPQGGLPQQMSEQHRNASGLSNISKRLSIRRKKKPTDPGENNEEHSGGLSAVKYLSQSEILSLEKDFNQEYQYSPECYVELCGLGCAHAIADTYPLPLDGTKFTILVICGSGQGGAVGMVCARHLKLLGYHPTIHWPKQSPNPVYKQLFRQLESLEISSLSYLPQESSLLDHSYQLVVDAVHDAAYDGTVIDPFTTIIERLAKVEKPIVSIDVPAGWPVDGSMLSSSQQPNGEIETGTPAKVHPEGLISLIAPKQCALMFTGKHHFLVNRFIPTRLAQKYGIAEPVYSNGPAQSYVYLNDPSISFIAHVSSGRAEPDIDLVSS